MTKALAVIGMVLLCCTTALAGMSHKMFKNPPAQVFEAALHVAEKYGTGLAVDREDQIISFTVGSWALSGTDHLTAFFHGLPDGCGKDKPCTATKIEVKANKVGSGFTGFRLGHEDVTTFFKRLQEELNRPPETPIKPAPPETRPTATPKAAAPAAPLESPTPANGGDSKHGLISVAGWRGVR